MMNPPCTTTTKSTTDESPAVTTNIHDGGAAPAPPSPKRRKVLAAATTVIDERARLKRRITWVADRIATHRDKVETPYGFPDDCYGFVGWVRVDSAGEERVGVRAGLEAWMQIEWEGLLLRWRIGKHHLGIDDDSSFGIWVDDQEQEDDAKTEVALSCSANSGSEKTDRFCI